ncbi:MAG: LSU ribosomal protein L24p (L26e) [uncultured Chloroflexi bacterium]|uniref:Large ribosomal subunit protein uL24 n=1 Tax=uncultured Chloroflexota bacterium TaxID=166587 RepID=A0A6J4KAB7_9CHLR|nr:MAG: LSU ribosomal protein L24p (L26e) [uncultured Chloroflexota bacterium]
MSAKVKKNDTVQVLTGRDRGKRGKVTRVIMKDERVVIEGINIRKRHTKAQRPGEQGGIVEFPAPLATSNVNVVCPKCDRPTRVGFRVLEDGKKVRVCRRDGEVIDNG